MEWISFLEWSQEKIKNYSENEIDELYKILFENYNLKNLNLKYQMFRNMRKVERMILEKDNKKIL